jgi:hypothetical protein
MGATGDTGASGDTGATGATGPGGDFVAGTNDYSTDALQNIGAGTGNLAIGSGAGNNYASTESNNIAIGASGDTGATGEIVIGTSQTYTVIAGINGSTTMDTTLPVQIDTTTGQLVAQVSSQRFKKDIQDMGSQSEAILALRPVTFHYKVDTTGKTAQFGLIAEEVAKIDPNLVARDAKGQVVGVRYDAVNAMLLHEFQKQHEQVVTQQKTIADLQSQVATLTAEQKEIADLKAQFEALKKSVDTK